MSQPPSLSTSLHHSDSRLSHSRSGRSPRFDRHLVVAIDLSDQSLKALLYAAHEVYRPGDCFHVVHINRCLQPQMTIQHTTPGSTYTIPDIHPFNEKEHSDNIKAIIQSRFISCLDELHIPHALHLYLDTDNSPAVAVANIVFRVAAEVGAAALIMACHNKAYGWHDFLLGSVADYCTQHCRLPLMIVRDYHIKTPPLTIPMASHAHSTN